MLFKRKNNKKFKLLGAEEVELMDGRIKRLHRIKALRDFGYIRVGDLGGYVEREDNLSHEGDCWIYDNAKVYGHALVKDDARVYDQAEIFDTATIENNSIISNFVRVYRDAIVTDHAHIMNHVEIYGDAVVRGRSIICDTANIHKQARVLDAEICDNAIVTDSANVTYASVCGDAWIGDRAKVIGKSIVISGNAKIRDLAIIYDSGNFSSNADIRSQNDYIVVRGLGHECRTTTFFHQSDDSIGVICGCFNGTLDEFRNQVKETYPEHRNGKEYLLMADIAESRLRRN